MWRVLAVRSGLGLRPEWIAVYLGLMTLFDGLSFVADLLPRGFVVTFLAVAWFAFPNATK